LKGISIAGSVSPQTTTFCNSYCQGKRKQIINDVANRIKKEQIPKGWDKAKIVHICPVADEVDQEVFTLFKDSLVGLTPQGSILYWRGKKFIFSAFKTEEKDPTGAGDVFAAAFLAKYYQTDDPIESSRFANCVASFAVEGKGTEHYFNILIKER